MANGQPFTLGGVNSATLPTSVVTSTISSGNNRTALIGWGPSGGTGVYGTTVAGGPNLFLGDVGVLGYGHSTGVMGQAEGGMSVDTDGTILFASTGVAGISPQGIGARLVVGRLRRSGAG